MDVAIDTWPGLYLSLSVLQGMEDLYSARFRRRECSGQMYVSVYWGNVRVGTCVGRNGT